MYQDDFEFFPQEDRTVRCRLGISMQQWLHVYPTPIPGDPSTVEDENRVFTWRLSQLYRLQNDAEKVRQGLLESAENCRALERLGATYRDANRLFLRKNGFDYEVSGITDKLYDPNEDFAFLYYYIGCMSAFIGEIDAIQKHS